MSRLPWKTAIIIMAWRWSSGSILPVTASCRMAWASGDLLWASTKMACFFMPIGLIAVEDIAQHGNRLGRVLVEQRVEGKDLDVGIVLEVDWMRE